MVDGPPGLLVSCNPSHTLSNGISNGGQGSSVPLVSHASNAHRPSSLLDCFAHRGANRRQQRRKACSPWFSRIANPPRPWRAPQDGTLVCRRRYTLLQQGRVTRVVGSDLEHRHVVCTRGKRPSVGPHCPPGCCCWAPTRIMSCVPQPPAHLQSAPHLL